MLQDMIQVYLAMIQYYILRFPYPVIVLIYVTNWYLLIGVILWFLPWGFGGLIRIGQWCLYQMTRLFPTLQDIGSKMDSVLNSWGLWLEGAGDMDGELSGNDKQKGKKRIPVIGIYIFIVLMACIFLIVPYYLESKLTGNSRRICAEINQLVEEKITHIQEFVDQYYTPKIHDVVVEEELMIEPEDVIERIILHLGARGRGGSNLRSSPEKIPGNIIDTVYGDVELVFENEMQKTDGIIWVKVSTEEISEAWISRSLLNEEEVDEFLYFED